MDNPGLTDLFEGFVRAHGIDGVGVRRQGQVGERTGLDHYFIGPLTA